MPSKLQHLSVALFSLAAALPVAAQPVAMTEEGPIIIARRLPPSDVLVRTVFVGDLDLKSTSGQQEMEKRVRQAVDIICSIPSPLPSYKGKMEQPCRDEAWASARPQMTYAVQRAHGS